LRLRLAGISKRGMGPHSNTSNKFLIIPELFMKRFIVLVVVVNLVACTTLRPIDGTTTELQQHISSGEVLRAGDRVLIVTKDSKTHRFTITAITADLIVGKTDSVPVDQVVSVEKREFSRAKTLLLIGGFAVVVGGAVFIAGQIAPTFAL
jgi:hypothetical protein